MKGLTHIFIKTFFFLAALASISSCTEKNPAGILSKQEMVQVMEELYIAEEKINHLALSRDSSKKVFTEIEAMVFEKAAVHDSVFRRSFDYYMERPKDMELIYTALVDTLQLREQRAPFRPDQQ
ncbi:MAG: DUF4296 domain-containing protein [Cyclobacteriaceae bacterium]